MTSRIVWTKKAHGEITCIDGCYYLIMREPQSRNWILSGPDGVILIARRVAELKAEVDARHPEGNP
jgi:hypothetical protein